MRIGGLYDTEQRRQAGSIYDPEGLAPPLDTCGGGNRQPIIIEYDRENETDTCGGGVGEMTSNSNTQYYQQDRVYDSEGTALCESANECFNPWYRVYPCLTPGRKNKRQNGPRFRKEGEESFTLTGQDIHGVGIEKSDFRIRKLTPRECYRLMGFSDEDFDKAKKVVSDSQLYKQAGNSIVVNVLEAIFGEML